MTEWKPIETAPKDGTAVWVWCNDGLYIGYFQPAEADWDEPPGKWFILSGVVRRGTKLFSQRYSHNRHDEVFGTYGHGVKPTHWQPLPANP